MEIPKQLQLGDDIELVIAGGIVKEEAKDNQDGSVNVLWIVKPISIEIK